jgi:DNA-binding CsgD family transcriptional regulator
MDLTRREVAVMAVLVRGKCDKEIAAALGISVRTVRFHLSSIFRKKRVTSRLELLASEINVSAPQGERGSMEVRGASRTGAHSPFENLVDLECAET